VSSIGRLQLHDPFFETERHRLVIVNFPDPFCGIPSAARLFDTTLRLGFLEFNPHPTISGFSDGNQTDSSTSPLLAISIASADQLIAVTFKELFCAFLTGGSMFAELAKASFLTVGENCGD